MTGRRNENHDVDVESRIAQALAKYMDSVSYDERAAFESIRADLGIWLGVLIDRHLEDEPSWSAARAIDDASPSVMDPIDALTVHAAGVAWLLADTSAGERHPFSARLHFAPSREALANYEIRFGDQAVGLGPNPSADRVRRRWPDVADWIFVWEQPSPA